MARNRNKRKNSSVSNDRDSKASVSNYSKTQNSKRSGSEEVTPKSPSTSKPASTNAGNDGSPDPVRDNSTNARSSGNDPEWYSQDNQLVLDAASIPYSEPLGDKVPLGEDMQPFYNWGTAPNIYATMLREGDVRSIAGICTVKTKASFGTNTTIKDPLNVAANMLYTEVRSKNSGRKNYDPADLMLYIASMADIYSYAVWCQRIYAKAYLYSQRNKYIGKALLASEGIDADDLKLNLANFRYAINTFINKLASYAIPTTINYFKRRVWIYSDMYIENPDGNIKDQLYQFSPDGFYRFNLDSNNAGMLQYMKLGRIVTPGANGLTFANIMAIGEWMWEKVTGDEDFALMSGDIVKTFEGNIIGLESLPEDVMLTPVYSEYVLEQIHNAVLLSVDRDDSSTNDLGNMTQDPSTGLLITREGIKETTSATYNKGTEMYLATVWLRKIISLNTPTPSPIDTMEITRLTISPKERWKKDSDTYALISCSSDIAVSTRFTYYDINNNLTNRDIGVSYLDKNWIISNSTHLDMLLIARVFKFAPVLYLYDTGTIGDNNTIDDITIYGEVNNYAVVDRVPLNKMHEVALLSLLTVPGLAKIVNY